MEVDTTSDVFKEKNGTDANIPMPTVPWAQLENINLLKHGTGTSLYEATYNGIDVIIKTPREGLRAQQIHEVVNCPSNYQNENIFFLFPHLAPDSAKFPTLNSINFFSACLNRRWN